LTLTAQDWTKEGGAHSTEYRKTVHVVEGFLAGRNAATKPEATAREILEHLASKGGFRPQDDANNANWMFNPQMAKQRSALYYCCVASIVGAIQRNNAHITNKACSVAAQQIVTALAYEHGLKPTLQTMSA
jgi:hypothetical protein